MKRQKETFAQEKGFLKKKSPNLAYSTLKEEKEQERIVITKKQKTN